MSWTVTLQRLQQICFTPVIPNPGYNPGGTPSVPQGPCIAPQVISNNKKKKTLQGDRNVFISFRHKKKHFVLFTFQSLRKHKVLQLWTLRFSHLYCGQASILITSTCSPAHLLAPTSHSVIVLLTVPTPELMHRGAESFGQSDTLWHTHFSVDSRIEKSWIYDTDTSIKELTVQCIGFSATLLQISTNWTPLMMYIHCRLIHNNPNPKS